MVDTSQWPHPDGTCKLCQNPLRKGQLQKLLLAGMVWQVLHTYHQDVSSSIENLDMDVANSMAKEVKNNWKVGLELDRVVNKTGMKLPKAWVALAGSHSQMTIFAHEKYQEDTYSFVRQEVFCEYYR